MAPIVTLVAMGEVTDRGMLFTALPHHIAINKPSYIHFIHTFINIIQ